MAKNWVCQYNVLLSDEIDDGALLIDILLFISIIVGN